MRIAPPVALSARRTYTPPKWEFWLRYTASTATTLLAIAGAQLVINNSFALMLAMVTLIGVPISLWLRFSDMHVGRVRISKTLWNGLTVTLTALASTYFVLWELRDLVFAWLRGANVGQAFWLRFSAGDTVSLLMQVFLIFAACRSCALITDKDTTLATVPSFSVLLLLIPVHKGIEVVVYFLIWTVVSATLFALDHRSESREAVTAYVPASVTGQEVRLSAKSLFSILGMSVLCAVALSYFLSSREPDERSKAETAVSDLASRITQFALSLPDVSVNAGPERQIDFNSGPSLPSRSILWHARPRLWTFPIPVHPQYWRMFTLTTYDGSSWSQGVFNVGKVAKTPIALGELPPRNRPAQFSRRSPFGMRRFQEGFKVGAVSKDLNGDFGGPTVPLLLTLRSDVSNIGFVPVQPNVQFVEVSNDQQKEVRIRDDGALDLGIVAANQGFQAISQVPLIPEYGLRPDFVERAMRYINSRRKDADFSSWLPEDQPLIPVKSYVQPKPVLDAKMRQACLALPDSLPTRVRQFAAEVLDGKASEDSGKKAERLSLAIQDGAVYTLRPPSVPSGRDAADYFLFEGRKRGYCTYFAGALTVLCRTQGIPARVVSGFVNPEWFVDGSEAIFREANAHAWTEIWVEGKGWRIVDATPADDRGDNSPTWFENWTDLAGSFVDRVTRWSRENLPVVILVGCLIGAAGMVAARRRRRGQRGLWTLRPQDDVDIARRSIRESYTRMSRKLTRRYRPRAAWETPDEWVQGAIKSLNLVNPEALLLITELYVASQYRPDTMTLEESETARKAVRSLDWKEVKVPRGQKAST